MTCVCANSVSAAHAITLLSQIEYIFVFFMFSILKTTPLNILIIIKKSPSTEYSDMSIFAKSKHKA